MKKITAIVPFLLIVLMMLLPLSGEAQSISRGKKKQATTTTTTKAKKSQTSSKRTSSKTKTKSNANEINVSTAKQFLDALGNNKTIVIQKSINLSSILDKTLELVGYKNLTIKGVNPSIRLGVSNGENLVFEFDSCENIAISNLVLGHEDVAECGVGVIRFDKCKGITISSCDVYGCGYYGIEIWYTDNVVCSNSNIHDCWTEMVDIAHSNNITFKNTTIKDSACGTLIYVSSSEQVQFEKCTFIQTSEGSDSWKCFKLHCYIALENCTIRSKNALGDTQYIKQSGCKWY